MFTPLLTLFLPSTGIWRPGAARGGEWQWAIRGFFDNLTRVTTIQDAEVRRLAGMLSKMDEDALKQRKEYDQVWSGSRVGGATR